MVATQRCAMMKRWRVSCAAGLCVSGRRGRVFFIVVVVGLKARVAVEGVGAGGGFLLGGLFFHGS